MLEQYSSSRLLRTEISTLIGLMIKAPIDLTLPQPETLQELIDRTDQLMKELHEAMNAPAIEQLRNAMLQRTSDNPFTRGCLLRESIFYGGESAYLSQYRDFSLPKYTRDNEWLSNNKGFTIDEAHTVVTAMFAHQNESLTTTLEGLREKPPESWTMLPAFTFSIEDIVNRTELAVEIVRSVVSAFTLPSDETNSGFHSVSDFNVANAYPIIGIGGDEYLCYQGYGIAEALYESPFYWMLADKSYHAASDNRGKFTEDFCVERLRHVFGTDRVLQNVFLYRGKERVAEIDVLVLFADRAIIVQAKSKRLTIESRKGNDNQLREDFAKGIQAAYDQGHLSAELMLDPAVRMELEDGTLISSSVPISEIYIFCTLSDHYPALSFQSRQFLETRSTDVIRPPFVMDIFTLDVVTEILASPLYFLSYINRRVGYADRIMASHELTILAYHLKQNLWIEDDTSLVHLGDDINVDLDAAMFARREGLPGNKTPDGLLTRVKNSTVGKLISQIEYAEDLHTINFGFLLLSLNEDTINQLSKGIEAISTGSRTDQQHHDVTIGIDGLSTGITLHANFESNENARSRLAWHCEKRKYTQRATTWYGVCTDPDTGNIRFGLTLNSPWVQSEAMDKATADPPKGSTKINPTTYVRPRRRKIGRNEPCPCGSGIKHKKCCLYRR